MCMNPTATATKAAPSPVIPVAPVGDPATAPVGDGAVKRASLKIGGRKRQIDKALEDAMR